MIFNLRTTELSEELFILCFIFVDLVKLDVTTMIFLT